MPPVAGKKLGEPLKGGGGPMDRHGLMLFKEHFQKDVVVLTKNMRCDPEDRAFSDCLARLRRGEVTEADCELYVGHLYDYGSGSTRYLFCACV